MIDGAILGALMESANVYFRPATRQYNYGMDCGHKIVKYLINACKTADKD